MPLVAPHELFKKAYEGKYAIGGFNVNNMEILQGILLAAEQERSPVILQISAGARKYAGHDYIVKMVEAATAKSDVPVVLHLDHGADFKICKDVIDGGFTSVMIDGSHHPFAENIAVSKEVVEYAKPRGVWVEAELGMLKGIEEDVVAEEHVFTEPEEAVEFVEKTGANSLAVAIGTSHGAYKFKGSAILDFERLEKIQAALPGYPLVLHGASSVPQELVEKANKYGAKISGTTGIPEDMLRKAATLGVVKINIDTDIRIAVTAAMREVMINDPSEFDPRKFFGAARDAVKELVAHKMRNVLGSSGKI